MFRKGPDRCMIDEIVQKPVGVAMGLHLPERCSPQALTLFFCPSLYTHSRGAILVSA